MTPIGILFTFFALFAWSRAYQRWRDRTFSNNEFLFWSLIWAAAIFLILFPVKSDFLAELLGVGRGADAVFAIGLVVLFYMVYRVYAKLDKAEKDLARLVRALALKDKVGRNLKKSEVRSKSSD